MDRTKRSCRCGTKYCSCCSKLTPPVGMSAHVDLNNPLIDTLTAMLRIEEVAVTECQRLVDRAQERVTVLNTRLKELGAYGAKCGHHHIPESQL